MFFVTVAKQAKAEKGEDTEEQFRVTDDTSSLKGAWLHHSGARALFIAQEWLKVKSSNFK